jgi:1-acyl-sn-glycerol-3-phosphate acyltransferase
MLPELRACNAVFAPDLFPPVMISALKILIIALYSCLMASLSIACVPFVKGEEVLFKIFRLYARGVLSIGGVSLTVRGAEHLERGRHYLYVGNHASLFDIPAVVAGIPDNVRFVYKRELNRVPVFGWGMKLTGYNIAIDRASAHDALKSIELIAERMRRGASVMLFPEGTRTPDGTLRAFKRGPFNLALKARVPIVPVAIRGSYEVLPRHGWTIRPGKISLVLGEPVAPPEANGRETETALRDAVQDIIRKNLEEG